MDFDTLTAWVIVGLLLASPYLLGGLVIFGLGVAAGVLVQRRGIRSLRREIAEHRRAIAAAHDRQRQAEESVVAYQHRAERERARAAALAADLRELDQAVAALEGARARRLQAVVEP